VPDDLHSIIACLEQAGGQPLADRFLSAVFATLDDLAAMPGKGSPKRFRGSATAGIRSWWVPGFRTYIIYYHTADHTLIVLAVLHGHRDVGGVLRERR
jgi:plasmid stabilization system protein ParE